MKTYRINKNAERLAQGTGFAPELIYNISLVRLQGRNGRRALYRGMDAGDVAPPVCLQGPHTGRIRQSYGAYPAGGRAVPPP